MILKSLSRKTPSFGQLAGYMSETGYMNTEKSDQRFEVFHNCFAQSADDIAAEFYENSQYLKQRKNGNYLYHEILSITVEDDVDREKAKEALRELALEYIGERAPNNMVYGALHDDHSDHIHYHLMISANERGSDKRYWISSKKLDRIKRDIEKRCLAEYPELKQQAVMTASNEEKKLSRKAAEQKRRAGKLERQDYARRLIFEAMTHTTSMAAFEAKLAEKNASYYIRGKTRGVEVLHPDGKVVKYRFKTIDVENEFNAFLANIEALENAQTKENLQAKETARTEQVQPEADETLDDQTEGNTQTEKPENEEADMKLKDAAGIAETYKDKTKKAEEAKKSDIKAEAKKTQAKVDKSAQDTAKQVEKAKKETVDKLKKEFEDITKKQMREQAKQSKK